MEGYYDPTTGTFTTRDPLDGLSGTSVEANPYHYADNNPLNRQDPTGLRPEEPGPFELDLSPISYRPDCLPSRGCRSKPPRGGSSGWDGDCTKVDGLCLPSISSDQYFIEGNLSARNIAIYLPATCQSMSGTPDINNNCHAGTAATRLHLQAGSWGSLAVMSWLGYETPDGIWGDIFNSATVDDTKRLAAVVKYLQKKGKNVSVIGHSWSGHMLSGAIKRGARPDNAIYLGTPTSSPLAKPGKSRAVIGSGQINYWWGCNAEDIICSWARDAGTVLESDSGGHNYFTPGSKILCNVGRVVVGDYDKVNSDDPC